MSRVLMLLCLTLGIVMTGCGGDEKGKNDKGGDKGSAADKAASGSKDTTDKGEKKDAKPGDGASVGKAGEMQTVSLKLPNMTWGGCEVSVRSALTKAGVFQDLKTDLKKTSATFKVSADVDFKSKLDEIVAGGNTHVKGYEVEKAAPAKGDGASLKNSSSMQFVSVNKTNDCCASNKPCCKACEAGDGETFVTTSTAVDDEEKKEEKKKEKKTKTVSLKLPNMTWGGCERSVRSALTKAGIFKNLKTDIKTNSATFKVSADLNFKKKLDEIVADGNKHVKGYKVQKKKKKTDVKTKTVSLKLPNMTWGGCERSVRSALTKAGVFKDLKTDVKTNTATFAVAADLDFKKKLNEIVEAGNTHVKGYEVKK